MILYSSLGFDSPKVLELCQKKLSTIRACLITSVKPDRERNQENIRTKNSLLDASAQKVDFFDFEFDDKEKLLDYNLVVLMGGDPFELFYWAKPAEEIFRVIAADENKIVLGISAGAMFLSAGIPYLAEWNETLGFPNDKRHLVRDLTGMKFTDMIIMPHYDDFTALAPELKHVVEEIEKRDKVKIFRLNNDETLYFEGGKEVLMK